MQAVEARRGHWSGEHRFFTGLALAMVIVVVLGFWRTLLFRSWFPEAVAQASPEPFFYVHGACFVAWIVLVPIQTWLVATRHVDMHRRLGKVGVGLAALMVVLGVAGALMAAARPTGFTSVPIPPLQFLLVPLVDIALFGCFVALAVITRRNPQSHKRYMTIATLSLLAAAVARWPFAAMTSPSPIPGFDRTDLTVDAFVVALMLWDVTSRRRLHPVTLFAGLTLVASQPLRLLVSQTHAWQAVATWLVALAPTSG